jgi:hypothetical protein
VCRKYTLLGLRNRGLGTGAKCLCSWITGQSSAPGLHSCDSAFVTQSKCSFLNISALVSVFYFEISPATLLPGVGEQACP